MVPEQQAREESRAQAAPPASGPVPPSALEPRGRALADRYLPQGHALIQGNRCALLHDGAEAFPAMLEAIRGARRTVRLCTYMFYDDAVGRLFGRALAEVARRGVDVQVLYDAVGNWMVPGRFYQGLRDEGVDVRPFKPLSFRWLWSFIRRDHRKLLAVDGEVAFVGGLNVAAQWAPKGEGGGWRDDVLRVEGPAARALERSFQASWRFHFGRCRRYRRLRALLARRAARRVPGLDEAALMVLSNRRSIHRAYLHAIQRARRSVRIAAAYFVPDRRLVRALEEAASRGVEVELLLNGKSDHPLVQLCARAFYQRLLGAGIRIYEWCGANLHCKTAVVDGVWGTIGSFNLERTSLWLNHEVNVVFADAGLGQALERRFAQDAGACRRVDPAQWPRRPLWQKVLERVLYRFRRMI
ncbi:MAG TPA: phospholipase D-like domain-containing protein [Myxococcales bacterium]|nr:phospholipase D-like domain-containing protein [Myxococcales bacterium]